MSFSEKGKNEGILRKEGSSLISPRVIKPNSQRTVDEMRSHIAKLKSELETEKSKNRQVHRDKISEIKQLKESWDKDKEHCLEIALSKLTHQKELEQQKLRDALHKEKDIEIRQLIRYKEDEFKQLRTQFSEEKEDAVKVALELQKKALAEQFPQHPGSGSTALVVKLQREIKALKDAKKELEEHLRIKSKADLEKAAEIRRLQNDHEQEVGRLIKDAKLEAARDLHQLKKAEEALHVKQQQITEKDLMVGRLVLEREGKLARGSGGVRGGTPNSTGYADGMTMMTAGVVDGRSSPKDRFDSANHNDPDDELRESTSRSRSSSLEQLGVFEDDDEYEVSVTNMLSLFQ